MGNLLTIIEGNVLYTLLSAAVVGFFGGLGSILLGGYKPSRWMVDKNGNKTEYVFGSIKEPFLGALGAILLVLPIVSKTEITVIWYFSLLTGFGSSKFLSKYINNKTTEMSKNRVLQMNNILPDIEISNEVVDNNVEKDAK